MEVGKLKRSKNFTEREKVLLLEVAKEFIAVIDNKKTDGTSVEAKKEAWIALTNKYNAVSESGIRTEKQLHALYCNLKKNAKKNMSDDKSEMYKTGGGTFCPKTTIVDEKVVALLTPQFKPLPNEFDSSAPYYDNETQASESANTSSLQGNVDVIILDPTESSVSGCDVDSKQGESSKSIHTHQPNSPIEKDFETTPSVRRHCITEMKKKKINIVSSAIIKRKNNKQSNEDVITAKKLDILDIQKKHELMKLEKSKVLLDLEIDLKRTLLENAKLDLEFKRKN